MVVIMRSEAMRYSISVRTELASDLPRVMGDPVQLQQVLMNLMTNSPQNVEGRKQKLIGRFWVTPEVYRASFVQSDVRTEVLAPVGSSAGARRFETRECTAVGPPEPRLEQTYNGATRNHFFTSAAAMATNKLQNRSLRPNRKYRSAIRRLPGLVDVISPKSGSVTPLSGLLKFG